MSDHPCSVALVHLFIRVYLATLKQFCHYVQVVVVEEDFVQFDDVRMVDRSQDQKLLCQLSICLRLNDLLPLDRLDRELLDMPHQSFVRDAYRTEVS